MKTAAIRLFFLPALCLTLSCKKDKPIDIKLPEYPYQNGMFIINEGPFSSGSGSVSFYKRQTGEVFHNIFENKNNRPVGSLLQSMTIHNNKAYLVVNNAAKIEVVSPYTFQSEGVITGLSSPRYFTGISDKIGYVSDWGTGGVAVVDLNSQQVIKQIPTGAGPEKILYHNGKAYVTNTGDWTQSDNRLTVINVNTHEVIDQIVVGDRPNSLVIDQNGMIWVLCGGESDWQNPANDTPGKLVKLDPATKNTTEFNFTSSTQHPNKLITNGQKNILYFLSDLYGGALYSMNINDNSLPSVPLVNRSFYGIATDQFTDRIFTADPVDFSQNGWIHIYLSSGSPIDSFKAGIIPGNFANW